MAHLIERMAYVGTTPWHGLGSQLPANQPIEVWQKAAGMDFEIKETEVLYSASEDHFRPQPYPNGKVLFRSDTNAPLSVVSSRYKVVQPREVLEFYRSLVKAGGFELETAGVLKEGRKIWALARTGQETVLKGGDKVAAFLLLATSCDGTLATTAQFTSVRVVCNNTLQLAVNDRAGSVRVLHSTRFDPALVRDQLGLGLSAWDSFVASIHEMAKLKVSPAEASRFLVDVLGDHALPIEQRSQQRSVQAAMRLFTKEGKGADLAAASGTVWGLLNAVTEHVDHQRRARSQDHRLDSAWFGQGAQVKARALEKARAMLA